jgi:hypothetical protein
MKDLQEKLQKLLADAEDCELIAKLATDASKHATFKHLATQLRKMAGDLEAQIAARNRHTSQTGQTRPSDKTDPERPQS